MGLYRSTPGRVNFEQVAIEREQLQGVGTFARLDELVNSNLGVLQQWATNSAPRGNEFVSPLNLT
jgi:hypothetical protein